MNEVIRGEREQERGKERERQRVLPHRNSREITQMF